MRKSLILASVASLLLAGSANATIFGGDDITNNYNTTNNKGGEANANAAAGAVAGAAAGAVAVTGPSTATVGDIRNTNTANGGAVLGSGNSANNIDNRVDTRDTNTNLNNNQDTNLNANFGVNKQGQQQSTSSSVGDTTSISGAVSEGSEASSSSDNAVTINDNDSVYYERAKRTVQSAIAPPTIHVAPCTVGGSAAVQTAQFGISLGGGKANVNCEVNVRAGLIAGFNVNDAEDYVANHDKVYSDILTKRRERESAQIAKVAAALKAQDQQASANASRSVAASSQPFTSSAARGTMAPIPNP